MKKGFTLIELMVVIGILAVLMGVFAISMGGAKDSAETAKVQNLVSETATALNVILQKAGSWPKSLQEGNNGQLDEKACRPFVKHGLMSLAYDKNDYGNGTVTLTGSDRCGIVDHWGENALKKRSTKSGSSDASMKADPAGGTVKDHILWYAIDDDDDGVTEINAEGIGSVKVRAKVCVWSCGKDGVVQPWTEVGRCDDVYSWQAGQVVK